jgi:tripartite-type tricarboxylate transporter receptor subunit TctC
MSAFARRPFLHASALLASVLTLGASGLAVAQTATWPPRPVHLVVANTPGSAPDVLARQIAPRLSDAWGQAVVVENKAGAAGVIAADGVAKSAPDGLNLLVGADGPITILPNAGGALPYDAQRDLVPVAPLGRIDFVLVANPSTGWRSLRDFVAAARQRPGAYSYASAGYGSPQQIGMELLKQEAGIFLTHIPYRGGPLGLQDVIAGQVQAMFIAIGPALPHIRSGKLVALATGGATRHALLPDVPAVAETWKDFRAGTWFGLFAPAQTPAAALDEIGARVSQVLQVPTTRQALAAQGIDAASGSRRDFEQQVSSEFARFAALSRRVPLASRN